MDVPKLSAKVISEFHQHDGLILGLINVVQSILPIDKYGMIGPYSLFREK